MGGQPRVARGIIIKTINSALVALILLLGWISSLNAAEPSLVINEIMWDGDEYIELFNHHDTAAALTDWSLNHQVPGRAAETLLTFTEEHTIAAHGYFLIEKKESATTVPANLIVSGLTLLNSGEQLTLKDSNGSVIDTANVNGAWLAGQNTSSGIAMERTSDGLDGTQAASWHDASRLEGGRMGSPAAPNSAVPINEPPHAILTGPSEGLVNQDSVFSAEDSSDTDDDALTFSWNFGDGATGSGSEVTHSFSKAGSYTVTLTVSDGTVTHDDSITFVAMQPSYSSAIIISEFLPDPVGSDSDGEFIELKNTGSSAVDMAGWQLDDGEGGSSPFTLSAIRLGAGSYLSLARSETKIALNNDGDSVRLLSPDGVVKTSFSYATSAQEGESYNNSGEALLVSTTVTPGQPNTITTPPSSEEEVEEETGAGATPSASAARVAGERAVVIPLEDIRQQPKDTIIQTEGVISVPPGVLGERVAYVAGSGIQLYMSDEGHPDLSIGDRVQLEGELSSYQGESRIKLAEGGVEVLSHGDSPQPHLLKTGAVDESAEGWLVTVQGTVTRSAGNTFYIDDGSGEVKVVIKVSTGIDKPTTKKGTAITITGIVSRTSAGYRLLPRFQEDIVLGRVAGLKRLPATGYSGISSIAFFVLLLLLGAWCREEPLLF